MAKVINVNLTQEGSTLASMKTTVDTIWAVHHEGEPYMDGYDLEDFISRLNDDDFSADHRVIETFEYTFFTDKAKALAFLRERMDAELETEQFASS